MKTDVEIKLSGLAALHQHLEMVEVEKFIALIHREKFDYTKWRQNLFHGISGKDISKKAMELQKS